MTNRLPRGIIAILAAAACAPVGRTSPSAALDRDEGQIFTLVIDSVLETADDPFVVVAESTQVMVLSAEEVARSAPGFDPAFPPAAGDDFVARNRDPIIVPRVTETGRAIRHLRLTGFDSQRDRDPESYGLRRYEPVRCFHVLARPGYDPGRTRAILGTASSCGGLNGDIRVILLERAGGRWRVTRWEYLMQG